MVRRTCKACTADVLHAVVWDEEFLLPAHEHGASVRVLHGHMWFLQLVPDVPERGEAGPVHQVLLLRRTPLASQETVPTANDLGVKVRRELGPVVCEPPNAQVTTQMRGRKIHILSKVTQPDVSGQRQTENPTERRTTIVTLTS